MVALVVLLFAFLISTCNEVHQKSVKENGEWKFPGYLKTGGAAAGKKKHHAHVASFAKDTSTCQSDSALLSSATDSICIDTIPAQKPEVVFKKKVTKPAVTTIPDNLLTIRTGDKVGLSFNQPMVIIPEDDVKPNEDHRKTEPGHEDATKESVSEIHLSDTEFITGMKVAESTVVPKVFFQTELTNHMVLLTAIGVQKSNLIHPQIGYGFHIRDHLLIPRIGAVFSPDGYRGVSLGFTEQYHHGHNVLLIANAEYTHSLLEAHESFAFLQIEGFRKIVGPIWLGGGLELLYEHEQAQFGEMVDLELLAGLGMRIYPGKHWFLYAQSDYDLMGLIESNAQFPHHWVMGNFGVTILVPHRKKT